MQEKFASRLIGENCSQALTHIQAVKDYRGTLNLYAAMRFTCTLKIDLLVADEACMNKYHCTVSVMCGNRCAFLFHKTNGLTSLSKLVLNLKQLKMSSSIHVHAVLFKYFIHERSHSRFVIKHLKCFVYLCHRNEPARHLHVERYLGLDAGIENVH